ncbi:MAG: DUF5668 domain-containing protein [Patescibacteria group bacterium]
MIIGLVLIIIGIVFLLQSFGYIPQGAWGIIWPAILIVIGLGILFKRKDHDFFWEERFGWGKKKVIENKSKKLKAKAKRRR